jgi:uncharacterized protein YdgA (DUF945 family)
MINKSYTKIGAAVVIALGATWLGTTVYGGQQIIKQYPEALAKLNASQFGGMKVVVTKQESGFLTSRVNWDLIVTPNPCSPDVTFKLSGYDVIHNGIFPSVGLGQIQTHILWPERLQPTLTKIFGSKEPLVITTNVGLLGALSTDISSPAVTYSAENQGTLDWKGFNFKAKYNKAATTSHIDFDFDGATMTSGNKQLVIKLDDIHYEVESETGISGLGLGEGELVLKGLNVTKDSQNFGFKDLKVKTHASEKGGFFAVDIKTHVAKLIQNDQSVGNVDLAFNVDHVDALALKNVTEIAKKTQNECKPSHTALIQAAQPIFEKGMVATLNHADVELFGGKAHAEAKFKLPPLTAAEVQDPKQGLQKVEIDGQANVTQKLITAIVDMVAKANSNGQPIDPQQRAQLESTLLAKPLSEGLIVKNAEGYVSQFSVRQGKTTVNGKPLNEVN